MNRVQWFRAALPAGLRSLASTLEAVPLVVDGPMGFRVERIRRESVEATYYERYSWIEQTVDPFGRESGVERSGYKSVRFSISREFPELELVDPPRGLKSFFSQIAEATNFHAAISPLAVDVVAWSRAFRKVAASSFRISGMTVSDLNVEDNVTGQLSVVSGQRDVEDALARLLSRRSYSVKKMQLSFTQASVTGPVIISSDGSVRSEKELDLDLIEALRQTIVERRSAGA